MITSFYYDPLSWLFSISNHRNSTVSGLRMIIFTGQLLPLLLSQHCRQLPSGNGRFYIRFTVGGQINPAWIFFPSSPHLLNYLQFGSSLQQKQMIKKNASLLMHEGQPQNQFYEIDENVHNKSPKVCNEWTIIFHHFLWDKLQFDSF